MFKKIHKIFVYCVVLFARPKEVAEATNEAQTPEQLDELIMEIYRGHKNKAKARNI